MASSLCSIVWCDLTMLLVQGGNRVWRRHALWPPEAWNSVDNNKTLVTIKQGRWNSLWAQRRERLVLTDEQRVSWGGGENAIWTKMWRIGGMLTGEDWGRRLLLARNKGTKACTYWINLEKTAVCFEYMAKDMWGEVVEDPTVKGG